MNRRHFSWLAGTGLAVLFALAVLRSGPTTSEPPKPLPAAPSEAGGELVASASLVLEVSVRDAGVSGAEVGLVSGGQPVASASTDPSGHAELGPVSPGSYVLHVLHPEHVRAQRQIELSPGTNRVTVSLTAAGALSVSVVDDRGHPVGEARVRVMPPSSTNELGNCVTGPEGRCTVGGLAEGSYRAYVHTGRFRPRYGETLRVEHGELVTQLIRLEAGRYVSGRVLAPSGEPIAGAHVGSSDEGAAMALSDSEGRFELGGMGSAPVSLFATAQGYAPRQLRGVRPGSAGFDITLEAPASVSGRVELQAPAEVLVSVCHFDPHFEREVCVARKQLEPQEDAFRIGGLASGNFELVLEAPAHAQQRIRVTLKPGVDENVGPVALRRSD